MGGDRCSSCAIESARGGADHALICCAASRGANFWILPVDVRGICVNRNCPGTFYPARWPSVPAAQGCCHRGWCRFCVRWSPAMFRLCLVADIEPVNATDPLAATAGMLPRGQAHPRRVIARRAELCHVRSRCGDRADARDLCQPPRGRVFFMCLLDPPLDPVNPRPRLGELPSEHVDRFDCVVRHRMRGRFQ